jgi:hypothetical protein
MKFPSVDEIVNDAILRSRLWDYAQGLPQPSTRQPMDWYLQERAGRTLGRQHAGKAAAHEGKEQIRQKQSPR